MAFRTRATAHGAADPRYLAAYPLSEAARYLRMPEVTLRSWVVGRWYQASGRVKRFTPLIRLDDPTRRYLSFINLVEAHVLAAIRRHHGVRLQKVRRALDYIRRQFGSQRPLVEEVFQTDGLDLFIDRYGQMINASRAGQQAMKEIIGMYLRRIDRDTRGLPVRLYPFTRDTASGAVPREDPRLIVMTPTISFGRPVIAGTGIPASAVFERYKAGDSILELSRDFRLESSVVEEAIRCQAA